MFNTNHNFHPRYTILLPPRACSQMTITDNYLQHYAKKNLISGCKILTRHTSTNPNSQFHIPVVYNKSDCFQTRHSKNGAKMFPPSQQSSIFAYSFQ